MAPYSNKEYPTGYVRAHFKQFLIIFSLVGKPFRCIGVRVPRLRRERGGRANEQARESNYLVV